MSQVLIFLHIQHDPSLSVQVINYDRLADLRCPVCSQNLCLIGLVCQSCGIRWSASPSYQEVESLLSFPLLASEPLRLVTQVVPKDSWLHVLEREEQVLDDLIQAGDAGQESLVGTVLSFPVADGSAWYLVVRETPGCSAPFGFQHILIGDCYTVPEALLRGLTREDILQQRAERAFWKSLQKINRAHRQENQNPPGGEKEKIK